MCVYLDFGWMLVEWITERLLEVLNGGEFGEVGQNVLNLENTFRLGKQRNAIGDGNIWTCHMLGCKRKQLLHIHMIDDDTHQSPSILFYAYPIVHRLMSLRDRRLRRRHRSHHRQHCRHLQLTIVSIGAHTFWPTRYSIWVPLWQQRRMRLVHNVRRHNTLVDLTENVSI